MARLDIEIQDKIDKSIVTTIKELNSSLKELEKVKKVSGKSAYSNQIEQERLESQRLTNETKKVRLELAQLTLEKRKGTVAIQAQEGSVIALRERLKELTKIYDSLSASARNSASVQGNLVPEINRIYSELSKAEQVTGRFQRQVGNYSLGVRSATGVTMEFNRIIQDLPFGMMGIGNNIQQLTSNWGAYVQSTKAAAAATGQTVTTMGLLRGVMASMLSPANLLTLAVAALTSGIVIYQRWQQKKNKEMEQGAEVAKDYAKGLNDISTALHKASQAYSNDITRLRTLMSVVNDATASTRSRQQALDELQKMYPAVFRNYDIETIKTNEAKKAYDELTNSIISAARARAAEARIAEKSDIQFAIDEQNKALAKQNEELETQIKLKQESNKVSEFGGLGAVGSSPETLRRANAENEITQIQNTIKKNDKEISANLLERAKIQENINELADLAKKSTIETNTALLAGGKSAEKIKDILQDIANIGRNELNKVSLFDLSKSSAEIQKIRNDYAKLFDELDEKEKEALKIYKDNEAKRTEATQLAIKKRAELLRSQEVAIQEVTYKQDTKALEQSLTEQYTLWKQYEDWRTKLGEEEANKRFANELDAIQSFRGRLERETVALVGKGLSIGGLNQAEQDRLDALLDIQKNFNKEQSDVADKAYIDLLTTYKSFAQKRAELTKKYNDDITKLDGDSAKERTRVYREEINKSLESELKGLSQLQDMDFELRFGSVKVAKESIKIASKAVKDWLKKVESDDTLDDATKQFARDLSKKLGLELKNMEVGVNAEKWGLVENIAGSFSSLVDSAKQFDGTMGDALKTISSMVGEVGNVASALGKASANAALQGTGQGLGVASAVISVVSTVWSAIEARQEKIMQKQLENIKYQEEYRLKLMQQQTQILKGQAELIGDIYGVARLEAYGKVLSLIDKEQEKLNKQANQSNRPDTRGGNTQTVDLLKLTGVKEVDDIIKKYNNNILNGIPNQTKRGAVIVSDVLKDVNEAAKKAGVSVEKLGYDLSNLSREQEVEIRSLIDLDLIDESTKKLLEAQLSLNEQRRNLEKALKEELTGTSFESLLSDVQSLFRNSGEDAAEAWAKGFEKIMENAMMQFFSREFLEERIKSFYDLFAELAKDGLDKGEVNQLQSMWNQIQQEGESRLEALREILQINSGSQSGGGIASEIKRAITEDTAMRLEGIWRGQYDQLRMQTELLKSMLNELGVRTGGFERDLTATLNTAMNEVADNTLRIADNTEYLKDIDETLSGIATGIGQVVKNTSQQSGRDLGI